MLGFEVQERGRGGGDEGADERRDLAMRRLRRLCGGVGLTLFLFIFLFILGVSLGW